MANIKRTIEIDAKADGFSRVVQTLGDELARSFEKASTVIDKLSSESASFGENLESKLTAIDRSVDQVFGNLVKKSQAHRLSAQQRLSFIEKELGIAERQLRVESERSKIAEKMRHQQAYSQAQAGGASPQQLQGLTLAHQSNMASIDEQTKIRELQMRGMRERYTQHRDDVQEEEARKERAREQRNRVLQQAARPFQQAAAGAAAGYGVAGIFSISGFVSKMIQEGRQLDEAEASTRGLLGRGISGGAVGYGMKRADYLNYAKDVIQAGGTGSTDVMGQLAFEKRFSQSQGSLTGLTRALRMEGSGRSSAQVAIEMLNFFKRSKVFGVEKGDFTQLAEKLEFNTQMLQQQGQQMHQVNATTNAQIIEAFAKADVDDQRVMDYTNSINQSIRQPGGDFTQAFMFRSLRRANPNASLLDILKIQEQGIYGEGTFAQIMEDLRGSFQGDALTMSISKAFGLQYHQAEQVQKLSPEALARIGTKEDIQAQLGTDQVTMASGKGGVGVVTRRLAQLEDWFADKGIKAIYKIEEYVQAFEKGGFQGLFSKMGNDIMNVLKNVGEVVGDAISKAFDKFAEKSSEKFDEILYQMGYETEAHKKKRMEREKEMREIDDEVAIHKKYFMPQIRMTQSHGGTMSKKGINDFIREFITEEEYGKYGGSKGDLTKDRDQIPLMVAAMMEERAMKEIASGAIPKEKSKEVLEKVDKQLTGMTFEELGSILLKIADLIENQNMSYDQASKTVFNTTFNTE